MSKVGEQLAKSLEAENPANEGVGMTKEDAKDAAKVAMEKGTKSVKDRISDRAQNVPERITKSEIFGSMGLTQKVQGAIGNDDPMRKQVDLQTKMETHLATLVKNSGNTFKISVE